MPIRAIPSAVLSKTHATIVFLLLSIVSTAHAEVKVTLGDGTIDGNRIAPYTLSWQQCAVQEGKWVSRGELAEELVVIGPHMLRHRQMGSQPGGVESVSDTYFDRASFAPLRMETEVTRDGERAIYVERTLNEDGYTGYMIRNGERSEVSGPPSSGMLHGMVMGLPLATIDVPDEPLKFDASMVTFDGTYDVIATWTGSETLQWNDREVTAQLIDVEWFHRETGDVYPPGPDESGGRFWVVSEPPAGFPYVPRYQTSTYAVEFVPGVCDVD